MISIKTTIAIILMIVATNNLTGQTNKTTMTDNTNKTEEQWIEELGVEKYRILRQCGTEAPFTGKYYQHKEEGSYHCSGCGAKLFTSDTKYDSGSGWPSFYNAIDKKAIKEIQREQPKTAIGTHKFIDWLCSKNEILTEPITPIEQSNIKNI